MNILDSHCLILKTYLDGIGFFGLQSPAPSPTGAWGSFAVASPTNPDHMVSFHHHRGASFGRLMRGGHAEHYGIKAIVRALNQGVAHRMAAAIKSLGDGDGTGLPPIRNAPVILNSNKYTIQNMYMKDPEIFYMGEEAGNTRRYLFSVNMLMVIQNNGVINPVDYTQTPNQDFVSFSNQGALNSQIIVYC